MINAQRTVLFSVDITEYELEINEQVFNFNIKNVDTIRSDIANTFRQPDNHSGVLLESLDYCTFSLTVYGSFQANVRVKATKCPRIRVHNSDIPTLSFTGKNEFTVVLKLDKEPPNYYAAPPIAGDNCIKVNYTIYANQNSYTPIKTYTIDDIVVLLKRAINTWGYYPFNPGFFQQIFDIEKPYGVTHYFDSKKEKVVCICTPASGSGTTGLQLFKPSERIFTLSYHELAQYMVDEQYYQDFYPIYLFMPRYNICPFPDEFYDLT